MNTYIHKRNVFVRGRHTIAVRLNNRIIITPEGRVIVVIRVIRLRFFKKNIRYVTAVLVRYGFPVINNLWY